MLSEKRHWEMHTSFIAQSNHKFKETITGYTCTTFLLMMRRLPGLETIKLFSYSTQVSINNRWHCWINKTSESFKACFCFTYHRFTFMSS